MCGAPRGISSDDRPALPRHAASSRSSCRSSLILAFALAPYAWMVLTSIKPQAELAIWPVQYLPRNATLEHYRELLGRTSFAGNLLNSLIIATRRRRARPRRLDPGRLRLLALPLPRPAGADDGFLVINMFPIVLLIIPLFVLMTHARAARHLPRRDPRPLDLRDPLRDLDADELLQRHPAGARRGGDDRRRDAARRRSGSSSCRW